MGYALDGRPIERPAHRLLGGVARRSLVTILNTLSLSIASGPPTVLLGPNGSGKSSVLHLAMGLMRPSRGSISWGGHPIEEARRLAIVFQQPVMLRRSVAANVLFAMRASGNTSDMPGKSQY